MHSHAAFELSPGAEKTTDLPFKNVTNSAQAEINAVALAPLTVNRIRVALKDNGALDFSPPPTKRHSVAQLMATLAAAQEAPAASPNTNTPVSSTSSSSSPDLKAAPTFPPALSASDIATLNAATTDTSGPSTSRVSPQHVAVSYATAGVPSIAVVVAQMKTPVANIKTPTSPTFWQKVKACFNCTGDQNTDTPQHSKRI